MTFPTQDYINYEKRFIYVEVYGSQRKYNKWRRIKLTEIEDFLKANKYQGCFATIQRYCVYKKQEGELQYAPLYFDLDDDKDITKVQKDVEKLLGYFFNIYDLAKEEVRVWFSGKKGFHVLIDPITLGVDPHAELPYIYKNIAFYLKELLDLKTLDPVVYSIRRQLRIPNTTHDKSRLFKIELDHSEVSLPVADLLKLAKTPRDAFYDGVDYASLGPNKELSILYKNFFHMYQKQMDLNKLKPQKIIKKSEDYPVCVNDLLENSIKKSGQRNEATMCLACYCKDQGWAQEDAVKFIWDWVQEIPKDMTSTKGNALKGSTIGCIRSIYNDKEIGKNYHFICSAMRNLDVECEHDRCKIAKEEDQEPEKIIEIELSEASEGCFVNKKLSCKVMVVGKDTSPYLTPHRVKFNCKDKGGPDMAKADSICAVCPIGNKDGLMECDLPKTASFVLETINCSTQQQISLLKKLYCANPKCNRLRITIEEWRNIEEVELNPGIDMQRDSSIGGEYVARKGYFIGHKLDVNQEFNVIGYVIPDPKSQHAVHIFDEAQPSETSLTSFKMTSEMKKKLKIFQAAPGKIEEKLDEIYTDLERNILRIWERKAMFIAMDLVYHSALRFKFQGQILQRGWVEGFIIGDSGMAKTDCFLKLRYHYNLGTRVSGEGSRRTGLAWTWAQSDKRWFVKFGSIPNNDRRLVCIDEAAGMADEELEKLTDMRECMTIDTDCLTKQGFKKYNKLSVGEEIYTINPKTLLAEWKPINNLYIYKDYDGKMIEINGQNLSACVTPNHKWLVKMCSGSGKVTHFFKETLDLKKAHRIPITATSKCINKQKYSNDLVRLIGWIITEGCYISIGQISISQSLKRNPKKVMEIRKLIKKLTGKEKIYYRKDKCVDMKLEGVLSKRIKKLFPDKKLTYKFINVLTLKQLRIFKDTLIAGDGNVRGKTERFFTTDEQLKNMFEYICVLLGENCKSHKYLRSILNNKHKDYYECFVKKSKHIAPFATSRQNKQNTQYDIENINYKGTIWCPNTKNLTFFARRNGKIFITGNSGIADATGGPVPAKAFARTRLLWMSNARNGQSLRTFTFPVEAVQTVFKKSEDIRRLDFAIGVVTGVVKDTVVHQNAELMAPVEHKFISDLCHNLILWAWTRTPEQIDITADASKAITEIAMFFGRRYSAKIPLVESAVMRIKLARLSVAIAARLFSTQDGETLIVKREHVEYIKKYLESQYDDGISLDYLNYSNANALNSDSIYDEAIKDYMQLPELKELNRTLMTARFWAKADLGDMLGYEKEELRIVMKTLHKHRLIEKFNKYRMTVAGIDFIKRFDRELKTGQRKIPELMPSEPATKQKGTDELFN